MTGSDNTNSEFRGQISGTGMLHKVGSGTFGLLDNSAYSGGTLIDGGTLEVASNRALGSGTGGTTVRTGATLAFVSGNYTTPEPVTLDGGTLQSGLAGLSQASEDRFAGPIRLTAASMIRALFPTVLTLTGASIDTKSNALSVGQDGEVVIDDVILGDSASTLTKQGPGTVTLAANNSYGGVTMIDQGTLVVLGSQPQSDVQVAPGGTLEGTGTVGNLSVQGSVQPGTPTAKGILTATSAVFRDGSQLVIRASGLKTPGTHYDQLVLGQTLVVPGSAKLLVDLTGLAKGGNLTGVVTYKGHQGTFASLVATGAPAGTVVRPQYTSASLDLAVLIAPDAKVLYVESVYQDVLGRLADDGGLTYWAGQLDHGAPRGDVAALLVHSNEYYRNIIVTPAYQRFLGRLPDQTGLAFWVDRMQNHALTDERLEAGFIGSREFYSHAGGTDKSWVDAMYQDLLGRAADRAGESYWSNQLAHGASRADVAYGFAASLERERQRISDDYMHYLGRVPDEAGLDYWVRQFAQGVTNEDVITGFVASDEYFQEHTHGATIQGSFAGAYGGGFNGTATVGGTLRNVNGAVAFTVDDQGRITLTMPGPGSGTVETNGTAQFAGTGQVARTSDVSYAFTGSFVRSFDGSVTASGNWQATFKGGSAAGTWWSAARQKP